MSIFINTLYNHMYKIMSNNLVECSNVVDLEAAVQYYTFLEIKLFTMLLKCIKKVILLLESNCLSYY